MRNQFFVSWCTPLNSMVEKFQDLEKVISYLETFQREIIFPGDTKVSSLPGKYELRVFSIVHLNIQNF